MRAMILAAGLGTRMRPFTLTTPKPLIPLLGKPLIEYHIERLAKAGINDIVINHAWLGEKLEKALGDGARWGVNIVYSREGEPLETAGGILKALPLLSPNGEPFWVINGDVWSDYDGFQCRALTPGKLAHLVLVDNPEHNPDGDFGLVGDHVLSDQDERHGYTFSGISLLSPHLFDGLTPGAHRLGPLLKAACKQDAVVGEHYSGLWFDIGTVERLQSAEQMIEQQF
jgi:MurNAc alpha-1-phosphate uridylyltransferase